VKLAYEISRCWSNIRQVYTTEESDVETVRWGAEGQGGVLSHYGPRVIGRRTGISETGTG